MVYMYHSFLIHLSADGHLDNNFLYGRQYLSVLHTLTHLVLLLFQCYGIRQLRLRG